MQFIKGGKWKTGERKLAAGAAFVTDARGIEIPLESALAEGAILRVVVSARRAGGEEGVSRPLELPDDRGDRLLHGLGGADDRDRLRVAQVIVGRLLEMLIWQRGLGYQWGRNRRPKLSSPLLRSDWPRLHHH